MKQKQIFEITDAAASQIIKSSESTDSKDWPLRIAVNIASDGKYNYMMGFDLIFLYSRSFFRSIARESLNWLGLVHLL